MPNYIPAMLHKLQHKMPTKYQGAPHAWTTPTYGSKVQYTKPADESSPVLPAATITDIQKKVGALLYYAVSVDPFMLTALGSIASSQAQATQITQDECAWLMDYAASNPLSIIRYSASDMQLYIHSEVPFGNTCTQSRSRTFIFKLQAFRSEATTRCHPTTQRSYTHHVQNYRCCSGISR
jgi:hypothetical protein